MNGSILLGTTIDKPELKENSDYLHFRNIVKKMSYSLKLGQFSPAKSLYGVISEALITHKRDDWLPNILLGDLVNLPKLESFILRLIIITELEKIKTANFTKSAFFNFHRHYKLLLLAYSQSIYRRIGPLVADIDHYTLDDFFEQYRKMLLEAFNEPANRRDQANVLQHIQGYFRQHLSRQEKQALSSLINQYHYEGLPLLSVLNEMVKYLERYPNNYLSGQYYLADYLKLLMHCYSK